MSYESDTPECTQHPWPPRKYVTMAERDLFASTRKRLDSYDEFEQEEIKEIAWSYYRDDLEAHSWDNDRSDI